MVLLMGRLELSKFFCAFSDMMTEMVNALVDTELLVREYGFITKIPTTRLHPPPPPHTHTQ